MSLEQQALAPRVLQAPLVPLAHLALSALQGQAPQGLQALQGRPEQLESAQPARRVSLEQQALAPRVLQAPLVPLVLKAPPALSASASALLVPPEPLV